jgi:malonyl-CoA O-methyltransferase
MFLKFIDQKIRQAFSDSAFQYEILSSLQKEIGRELTKKIEIEESFSHILDVGMGTGWLTNRLALLFPEAKVVGIDFADGMVEEAKKKEGDFSSIQADARNLPFQEKTFDIIVSNLAYQWVEDLAEAFRSSFTVLKPKGKIYLTIFGKNTLKELFTALEQSEGPKAITRLAGQTQIEAALNQAGFQNLETSSETIKVHFKDMMALVKWLKEIGANVLQKDIYVGRDLLARANEYYKEHFKDSWGVYASFEVIWVKAEK